MCTHPESGETAVAPKTTMTAETTKTATGERRCG
jgi:hypothetical protein